ncbi:PREDICTED: uncharacterized protein LOC109164500 [Ipomoea nil]|uniref:uncharacterized protein LOC109164500 n=1 Tax=Ipomoea nil TaxID=35883 RepID=UPI00090153CC|nr:PREDICTED: uncharacterized protein LOC109164500 [Ipomoea nil]
MTLLFFSLATGDQTQPKTTPPRTVELVVAVQEMGERVLVIRQGPRGIDGSTSTMPCSWSGLVNVVLSKEDIYQKYLDDTKFPVLASARYNLVILGDESVGKSSIITHFMNNKFCNKYEIL